MVEYFRGMADESFCLSVSTISVLIMFLQSVQGFTRSHHVKVSSLPIYYLCYFCLRSISLSKRRPIRSFSCFVKISHKDLKLLSRNIIRTRKICSSHARPEVALLCHERKSSKTEREKKPVLPNHTRSNARGM